ncbi:uncharacterized protein LOC131737005 [Acipenser ruthenus]|uniref:uncharacterized protein LOC131737005 n=1 Tax=Acipenser ruthenus TaxID=7906 RepID=UPI0027419B16|nr:uncharacterized protein LOC131737005 [Acipenser ruthenus]
MAASSICLPNDSGFFREGEKPDSNSGDLGTASGLENHSSLLLVDPKSALHENCRMQPGYSAKHYLSSWSVNLDKKTLNKLKDAVHMSDNTHFKNQPEDQHLYQPLYEDLSVAPKPLRVHLPRVSLLDYVDLAEGGNPYTSEKFQFHPDNGALSQSINSHHGLLLNTEGFGTEGSSNEQEIRKQAGSHTKNKHRDILRKGLSDRLSPGPVIYTQWNHTEDNKNFASFYGGCLRGSRRAISVRLPPLLRPRDSSPEGRPGVSVEKGKDCGTSSRHNNDKWNSSGESYKLHTVEKYEHGESASIYKDCGPYIEIPDSLREAVCAHHEQLSNSQGNYASVLLFFRFASSTYSTLEGLYVFSRGLSATSPINDLTSYSYSLGSCPVNW